MATSQSPASSILWGNNVVNQAIVFAGNTCMEALEIKLIVKVCSIAGTRSSSYLLNCNEIKLILPRRIFLR